MEVTLGSKLQIIDTNITDNAVYETGTMIYVSSGSSLRMKNNLYVRNNMTRHIVVTDNSKVLFQNIRFINNMVIEDKESKKALIATKGSNVNFYECHFLKNVVNTKSTSMLLMVDGNTSITNTKMTNNTVGKNLNILGTKFIIIDSSLMTKVSNSIFMHNVFYDMLNVVSASSSLQSLLLIDNCSFILNVLSSISTENVQVVLIKNSFSHIHDDPMVVPDAISINNAKSFRIKGSVFNATDSTLQIYLKTLLLKYLCSHWICVFCDNNRNLTSNRTNFLHKAKSIGYIRDSSHKVVQKETPYASSKYKFHLFFFPVKHLSE